MLIFTYSFSLYLHHMHTQARPHDAVSICLVILKRKCGFKFKYSRNTHPSQLVWLLFCMPRLYVRMLPGSCQQY